MNVYLDIETIPVQDGEMIAEIRAELKAGLDAALNCIRAPANYKDAAKIDEYVNCRHTELVATHEATVQDAILKTSFDGGLGQICVIGWAIEDEEPNSYQVDDLSIDSERKVLQDFFCVLTDRRQAGDPMTFVGHNLLAFDLRFIWQRAMVLDVRPPYFFPRDPKPWGNETFDTMLAWGLKAGGSMAKLCRIFGIPGKGDMDGSKVWPAVQEGRLGEVAAYCREDVARTRALHQRMTFAKEQA